MGLVFHLRQLPHRSALDRVMVNLALVTITIFSLQWPLKTVAVVEADCPGRYTVEVKLIGA